MAKPDTNAKSNAEVDIEKGIEIEKVVKKPKFAKYGLEFSSLFVAIVGMVCAFYQIQILASSDLRDLLQFCVKNGYLRATINESTGTGYFVLPQSLGYIAHPILYLTIFLALGKSLSVIVAISGKSRFFVVTSCFTVLEAVTYFVVYTYVYWNYGKIWPDLGLYFIVLSNSLFRLFLLTSK